MRLSIKNYQKKIPIPQTKIRSLVLAVSDQLRLSLADISLVFVGARRMRTLNRRYLGHDYVTDVLTFDLGERCAEIIICPSVAFVHAMRYQTFASKEIILYLVHGLLHLAGFKDDTPDAISKMRRMEEMLLALEYQQK